jgi:hypothetical protein
LKLQRGSLSRYIPWPLTQKSKNTCLGQSGISRFHALVYPEGQYKGIKHYHTIRGEEFSLLNDFQLLNLCFMELELDVEICDVMFSWRHGVARSGGYLPTFGEFSCVHFECRYPKDGRSMFLPNADTPYRNPKLKSRCSFELTVVCMVIDLVIMVVRILSDCRRGLDW